ncbi:26S proteasome non-ATPase regulatory subunit 5 [Entophlyctis helioformis]|nr:26S proteasome non-ATPase regulatory subunit 5 [Entophlyctis helioformis]
MMTSNDPSLQTATAVLQAYAAGHDVRRHLHGQARADADGMLPDDQPDDHSEHAVEQLLHKSLLAWRFALSNSQQKPLDLAAAHGLTPQLAIHVLSAVSARLDSIAVTQAACILIDLLLAQTPFADISASFEGLLQAGLTSHVVPVNKLVLDIIRRAVSSDEDLRALLASSAMIYLVSAIAADNGEIAKTVSDILCQIARRPWALSDLLSDKHIEELQSLAEQNLVVQLRVYELFAHISLSSPEAFALAERTGVLAPFTQGIFTADIFESLNVIEMLIKFAESDIGYEFLEKMGVLDQLFKVLQRSVDQTDVTQRLEVCAAIKFWGFLLFHQPSHADEIQNKFDLLGALQPFLEDSHEDVKDVILVAVSNFGSTLDGLRILYKQRILLDTVLDKYKRSVGDVRVSVLRAVSCLVSVESRGQHAEETERMTRYIYDHLNGDRGQKAIVKDLVHNSKSSIEELAIAAYAVLDGILSHAWGMDVLAGSLDLTDLLIERQPNALKIIKEWKFSLVKTTLANPVASNRLGGLLLEKLRAYSAQGPYYAEAQPLVAMESG